MPWALWLKAKLSRILENAVDIIPKNLAVISRGDVIPLS